MLQAISRFIFQLIDDLNQDSIEAMCSGHPGFTTCMQSCEFRPRRDMFEREAHIRRGGRTLAWLGDEQPILFPNLREFLHWEHTTYGPLLDDLQESSAKLGSVEGSLWAEHSVNETSMHLAAKRQTLLELVLFGITYWRAETSNAGKEVVILNLGFNAGHSAAMLLWTFPTSFIYSFDLCGHTYTESADALIKEQFGQRHKLICGDSRFTLAEFLADPDCPQNVAVVFVDGDHTYYGARGDIEKGASLGSNAKPLALIADDCWSPLNATLALHRPIELMVSLAWRHATGIADTSFSGLHGLCFGISQPRSSSEGEHSRANSAPCARSFQAHQDLDHAVHELFFGRSA